MPLTAEEAESGLDLKHHIDANIEAFTKLPQTESNKTSIEILEKLDKLNDARFNFFKAQKKMMEELAGELKKLAEHIATINKVEAAINGQPTQGKTNNNASSVEESGGSPLIAHIKDIEQELGQIPITEDIHSLVAALEQIVALEHERHGFSGQFKQTLEMISQVLGKLPDHTKRLEGVKQVLGGSAEHHDNEGGEIADRDQEQ